MSDWRSTGTGPHLTDVTKKALSSPHSKVLVAHTSFQTPPPQKETQANFSNKVQERNSIRQTAIRYLVDSGFSKKRATYLAGRQVRGLLNGLGI